MERQKRAPRRRPLLPLPYKDYKQARGEAPGWTIGIGHLVKDGEDFSRGLTKAQVEELFHRDLADAYAIVARYVTYPLTQSMFDSLCCTVHNVRAVAIPAKSTAIRCLNAGDVDGYCTHLLEWNKSGEPLRFDPNLFARRQLEAQWFREPDLAADEQPDVFAQLFDLTELVRAADKAERRRD